MITWVLEQEIFSDQHEQLRSAAEKSGHEVVSWKDDWWSRGGFPEFGSGSAVFHGSLGNAARIRSELEWTPGAFCDADAFLCSNWYPSAREWLLHSDWRVTQADCFVNDPGEVLEALGNAENFFVRPDSPLKPFSGRVLSRDKLSLKALDHGFYYDDETISIVVAPIAEVGDEWRFVVAEGDVVAGCRYEAEGRKAAEPIDSGREWSFAQGIAAAIPAPEPLYVLDLCQSKGELRLLELNPFSGADLYACDRDAIVRAVAELLDHA